MRLCYPFSWCNCMCKCQHTLASINRSNYVIKQISEFLWIIQEAFWLFKHPIVTLFWLCVCVSVLVNVNCSASHPITLGFFPWSGGTFTFWSDKVTITNLSFTLTNETLRTFKNFTNNYVAHRHIYYCHLSQ